ncbi:MAG: hypothetical protein EXR63_00515 [Dehalococcoidia bacterium]|nr:hypothetical protein [Dehalococcoidia bacterium]
MTDGQERTLADCREALAEHFSTSDDERAQMLPSGRKPVFNSRIHWAKTYLEKAGVLRSTGRGRVQIADRGLALSKEALCMKEGRASPQTGGDCDARRVSHRVSLSSCPVHGMSGAATGATGRVASGARPRSGSRAGRAVRGRGRRAQADARRRGGGAPARRRARAARSDR